MTLLTLLGFLLLGYHPFAEDAGIYRCGIQLVLNPGLYPGSRAFILAHMHRTLFPYFLGDLVRLLHLPLEWVLLLTHIVLLWLVLYAALRIARHCFAGCTAQWTAVTLLTLCLETPVAGTALSIADPSLTPRSFATALSLLLLCAVIERRPAMVFFTALLLTAFHPLMALYAIGTALILWMLQARRSQEALRICFLGLLAAAVAMLTQHGATEAPEYIAAALSRTYFYLGCWQWYEIAGLIAPLAIFAWVYRSQIYRSQRQFSTPQAHNRSTLAGAALLCGLTAILISLLFVHPDSHSHMLARLQPLRIFHTFYILLFLLIGGTLAERLSASARRFVLIPLLCATACMMFCVERSAFPASAHLEMPWRAPSNPWQQAFLWIRENTPQNALIALDRNYITAASEDAQNFRAVAERSSLPDYSKDGGSSAVFPQLAPLWLQGELTTQLNGMTDAERIARLKHAGVTWIILQQQKNHQHAWSQTNLFCPYRNNVVLVCALPVK